MSELGGCDWSASRESLGCGKGWVWKVGLWMELGVERVGGEGWMKGYG